MTRPTGGEMNCGAVAVNLFFALSGYLVSASWQRLGSFRRFMEARTPRIFPAFVLLMLWQAFFVTPISLKTWAAVPSPHQMPRLLAATLSFNSVTPPAPSQGQLFAENTIPGEINGSLWTIRYEFLCYLLLGLAGCASLLNRRWFRLGLFALLLALFVATPDLDLPSSIETALGRWSYWGRWAVYFLAGTVVYWDARFLRMNGITLVLAISGVVVALAGPVFLQRLLGPLLLPWLMMHIAYLRPLASLGRKLPGDFSYGLYLYGFPIQQLLMQFFPSENWSVFGVTAASTAATLPFAVASWYWVERPCLRLKRKAPPAPRTAT
jgi:peptidoglycan/LPS O-acetylase OafA/YrhL